MSAQLRHMATDKMGVALTRVSLFKDSHLSSINSLRQPGMLFIVTIKLIVYNYALARTG